MINSIFTRGEYVRRKESEGNRLNKQSNHSIDGPTSWKIWKWGERCGWKRKWFHYSGEKQTFGAKGTSSKYAEWEKIKQKKRE